MRVLVCGSRDWGDHRAIYERLQQLPPGTTIVHGAASRKVDGLEQSADALADLAAKVLGYPVEVHPADWRRGRHAGLDRNIEMLDSGVDLVVAFQLNLSRGTQHTINEARRRGIALDLHRASL